MPCTVDIKNDKLYVKFYSLTKKVFYEKLDQIRGIPKFERKFLDKERAWQINITKNNIELLLYYEFEFINKAKELLGEDYFKPKEIYLPEINESLLDNRLYPFQIEGVRFLEGRNGLGGIFDQMGLGKTLQTLMYLKLYPELRPVLIVCPKTLKLNWKNEIYKWLGDKETIQILYGRKPNINDIDYDSTIFIINYDILAEAEKIEKKMSDGTKKTIRVLIKGGWWDILRDVGLKLIIADECQKLSNYKAIKTKAFIQIKKVVDKFIPLSGTPIMNKPAEFFTILNLLDPVHFSNRYSFLNRFCDPKFNGFGHTYNGLTNGDELYKLIYPLMIRRLKKDVLKELPDITAVVIPLECSKIDLKDYYDKYEEIFSKELNNKIKTKNQIELLKQLIYVAKRDFIIEWIKDFLESGEKLVLFGLHIKVLDDIQNNFKKISVRIDGSVSTENREKAVNDFQNNDKIKLFIGQIRAAGEGITLTAASSVVFVELDWNPAIHHQALSRIHRISQKSDAVFIYYLIANGTIEDNIIKLLQKKDKMLGKVLDGKEKDFIDADIYDELIDEIKGNKNGKR